MEVNQVMLGKGWAVIIELFKSSHSLGCYLGFQGKLKNPRLYSAFKITCEIEYIERRP